MPARLPPLHISAIAHLGVRDRNTASPHLQLLPPAARGRTGGRSQLTGASMQPAMCVTLSWDDGHPLDSRIADMMSRYHLRGTFYIPRTAERGTMRAAQIRELSQTFEVGAH